CQQKRRLSEGFQVSALHLRVGVLQLIHNHLCESWSSGRAGHRRKSFRKLPPISPPAIEDVRQAEVVRRGAPLLAAVARSGNRWTISAGPRLPFLPLI